MEKKGEGERRFVQELIGMYIIMKRFLSTLDGQVKEDFIKDFAKKICEEQELTGMEEVVEQDLLCLSTVSNEILHRQQKEYFLEKVRIYEEYDKSVDYE